MTAGRDERQPGNGSSMSQGGEVESQPCNAVVPGGIETAPRYDTGVISQHLPARRRRRREERGRLQSKVLLLPLLLLWVRVRTVVE